MNTKLQIGRDLNAEIDKAVAENRLRDAAPELLKTLQIFMRRIACDSLPFKGDIADAEALLAKLE